MQPAASVALDVQLAPDFFAKAYKVVFAFPCRDVPPCAAAYWFTSAIIPANAGAEADVPPTM
jgi:hypothetical protein